MVYRVYVEKRPELATEAASLLQDLRSFLGVTALTGLRLLNRYDVEGVDEALFSRCVRYVLSEPQTDVTIDSLAPLKADRLLAIEYLPGQFDQRADSAAQCIQFISQGQRPAVRSARIYALYGSLTDGDVAAIRRHLLNPVESREASLEPVSTLQQDYPQPAPVAVLTGFREMDEAAMEQMIRDYGLAMDVDDLRCCRTHFCEEGRDPTVTELKLLDTYWSDHCRHTTFHTIIDEVRFSDPVLEASYHRYLAAREQLGRQDEPVCLMDMGTLAARMLKAAGRLDKLDESEEVNACTVKITVTVDGEAQSWLLLFKNETHNHPTEIEPFGGAATCIGGAIRDPLSGRSYVYAAMRLTGAADPLKPLSETLAGKLPQRKLTTTAAAGYSAYGNQIGLPTGLVDEWYHPGYAAKRMEIGAVIAAAPAENVRRETPAPGDLVILLGGRTGRDGIGGATGSSKSHTVSSLETCGAEVQKGNAPEERKLQRLFRHPEAAKAIKRCNDFGAGGVAVAVGELADGLHIDLSKVTRKYEGLDGTELAISESQERMAVVVAPEDADAFCALAFSENLEATVIAEVTAEPRLVMDWNGTRIVDISRAFLDTNGAPKHITVAPPAPLPFAAPVVTDFSAGLRALAADLNVCSRRGLAERFDATIGAGTVLMPFGGKNQLTPIQAMVQKISVERGHTDDCSFMSWGFDPYISEKSPYHGAYLAVLSSVAKLAATGASLDEVYLSFQEYFEKPGRDPSRWGKPFAALLGALDAQLAVGAAAIGGKDSMSGSFEKLDVPPTLVSFAVTTGKADEVISPELKQAGSRLVLLQPIYDDRGLPETASFRAICETLRDRMRSGKVLSAWAVGHGGIAEGLLKMSLGNGLGVRISETVGTEMLFDLRYGSFLLELREPENLGVLLGEVTAEPVIRRGGEAVSLAELQSVWEEKLESVFPTRAASEAEAALPAPLHHTAARVQPLQRSAKPRVLIPVFPGTNCEYDSAKAFADAGAEPLIYPVNNLTADSIRASVSGFAEKLRNAQILFVPGGFSGGDEPDGSGKFITAFLRSPQIADALTHLLDQRLGLACGICNGFQALIKLGLVPFGKIVEADASCPTLTFNTIGRHQSRIVRTRVASDLSPWLRYAEPGKCYSVAISHGEGRFLCEEALLHQLLQNGQIVTQYADAQGQPTMDIRYNPNGSTLAVEGICSPDGRVLGKMGHCERIGSNLYRNVPGDYDLGMFRAAVDYFA